MEVFSRCCQDGTFDNDAGVDVLPHRDEQLAGKRDDRRLLLTPAIVRHSLLEPRGERGVWLMGVTTRTVRSCTT